MALAKERARQNSQSAFPDPTLEFLGFKGHHGSMAMEEGNFCETLLVDPSNNIGYNMNCLPNEVQSNSIMTLGQWAYLSSSSSVLSFDQGDRIPRSSSYSKLDDQEGECSVWMDSMDRDYQESSRLARETENCFEMASGYGSMERQDGEERFDLVYPSVANSSTESFGGEVERSAQKRPYMGGDMQLASKKHCGNNKKVSKAKPSTSKDPQSIAAKNRRERISERLKILQDLVPNGTKVDLVTMLEKAISYVKFLQLQVKVLATDEFWPAQGGQAPEVSQVKEAIDAILSSHSHKDRRTTTSTSKQ